MLSIFLPCHNILTGSHWKESKKRTQTSTRQRFFFYWKLLLLVFSILASGGYVVSKSTPTAGQVTVGFFSQIQDGMVEMNLAKLPAASSCIQWTLHKMENWELSETNILSDKLLMAVDTLALKSLRRRLIG